MEDPLVAIALVLCLKKKTKRKRTRWMKKWLMERHTYGHVNLLTELRSNAADDYKNFLRMDGDSFDELLTLVAPLIQKHDTMMRESISPLQRLSITLRYLATGNTFEDLKFMSAISPQSIGRIVMETCDAIITCLKPYIKLPTTPMEWKLVADDFKRKWNFPHCIGAVDGKHVALRKPQDSGSYYYNYKKFFSIVLMAVVDANYQFLMVDVGVNGRISDGGVISETVFGHMLNDNELQIPEPEKLHEDDLLTMPYVFLGDDAFTMTENFLKPYPSDVNGALNTQMRIFNYRLSRARRVVENAFGILASRFGVFQRQILLSPDKAETVTLACCYLHNFLGKKSNRYINNGTVDWEDPMGHVHLGAWRETQGEMIGLQATRNRNMTARAKATRETFRNYFCTRGEIPWQLDLVS